MATEADGVTVLQHDSWGVVLEQHAIDKRWKPLPVQRHQHNACVFVELEPAIVSRDPMCVGGGESGALGVRIARAAARGSGWPWSAKEHLAAMRHRKLD